MIASYARRLLGQPPVTRGVYLVAGLGLVCVKHALDWTTAVLFGQPWSPLSYVVLPAPILRLADAPGADRAFLIVLLALAVPFIVVGVRVTAARLRDAGLPVLLVVLFFVPLVNYVFFLLLCLLPGRSAGRETTSEGVAFALAGPDVGGHFRGAAAAVAGPFAAVAEDYQHDERWQRLRTAHQRITRDRTDASAALALAVSVPVAVGFTVLSAQVLQNYGAGLFLGIPFCLGMGSVVLYGLTRPRSFAACLGVALLAATLAGICLLIMALEGAICLLMAAPIWYALVVLGAVAGWGIQARPFGRADNPVVLLALLAASPGLIAAESVARPEPELVAVVSAVDVDAPAEAVWRNVISFPPLAEPDDWVFRTGVAYPVRADIEGRGPGAVRYCVFSTGAFVEPIEDWREPELLRFRVEDQPEPMREWSPYTIHPPHLHGFLVSHRGQFKLTPLPGGRTRLEGTTWYTNRMWPASYWQLWSDAIIRRIHLRVLRHIRTVSEGAG
jgi:hypothetical protein